MDKLIKAMKIQNTEHVMLLERGATHRHLILEAVDANEAQRLLCVLINVDC